MNSFKCQDCGGGGGSLPSAEAYAAGGGFCTACPTCHGKEMELVVKCSIHGFDSCDMDMDGICSGSGGDCAGSYHEMTEQEVDELINRLKPTGTTQYDPIELLMDNIKRDRQTYKGQPVTLRPKESE